MFFFHKGGALEEPLAAKLRRLACAHDDPLYKDLVDGFLASQGFQSDVDLNSAFGSDQSQGCGPVLGPELQASQKPIPNGSDQKKAAGAAQETKDFSRKPSAAGEEVGFATPTRARLGALESTPKKVTLQADDEGSETSTQAEALLELVRELKMGREEDRAARDKQAANQQSKVFTFKANEALPIMGDRDSDLEKHMQDFEDFLAMLGPTPARDKLKLFGKTLKGTKLKCYSTVVKDSRTTGEYDSNPLAVLDKVAASLDASFHESEEARSMRAKSAI